MTEHRALNIVLAGAEWLLLLAALSGLTLTEEYRPYVIWALVALLLTFPVRRLRTGRFIYITGLEVPTALFVAGAGVGVWAAYNRPLAVLLFARILAATALYYTLAASSEKMLRWVAAGFVLAAAALALYWPIHHDFGAEPAKLAPLTQAGRWINVHFPHLPGPSIHGNIAGGALTLALPFAVALGMDFWRQHQRVVAIFMMLLAVVLAGGLALTGNRGGWLSVATVAGLAVLAWVQRRWCSQGRRMTLFWGVAATLVLAAVVGILTSGHLDRLLGALPDSTGSLQKRTHLWGQGLALVRDYAFTGCGLGAFPMVFSTYSLLIYVPYLSHIHNTYLEVWIEQGALGALACVWGGGVGLAWAWRALRSAAVPLLGWAGLAALAALAVHGVFDVAIYGARTMPLLGLVAGYGWLAVRGARSAAGCARMGARQMLAPAAGALALLAVALLLMRRPLLGAWYADLGALAQMRVELGAYNPSHFDNPTLDRVRQVVDLSAAERRFAQALAWNGSDLTARQRLGAIALSRGQYEAALAHMQVAWESGHRDRVTRLLLGDALVASGRVEEAVKVVRGLTWSEERLKHLAWYRYWHNEDYTRAAYCWHAVVLLNPGDANAAHWQAEAEARAQR